MLADAQVDVIFDVTNQETYRKNTWRSARSTPPCAPPAGTPQIAFLAVQDPGSCWTRCTPTSRAGAYHDLWFLWDGKPRFWRTRRGGRLREGILHLPQTRPSYFTGPSGPDQWGWLEVHRSTSSPTARAKGR